MNQEWIDEESYKIQNMNKESKIIEQLRKERSAYKKAYEILEGTLCGYRIGSYDLAKARSILKEALKKE